MNSKPTEQGVKASWKVPTLAFSLAAFSIICALAIGFFAFESSLRMTEREYHQFYLKEAQMLVKAAEILKGASDEHILRTIQKIWGVAKEKPADEYICIVNRSAHLLLHSAHPNTVGNYAGANQVLGNKDKPACSLSDLVKLQKDYVGEYISSAGQKQIAAFAASAQKGWMVGIHRSKSAVMKDVEGGMRFSKYGFLIICGLLMPLSLLLIYITFNLGQKQRIQAETALRESEEKYRQMVESTADWVWTCDVEGRQTFSNQAVEQILGYEVHELLGISAFSLMHPAYQERIQKWLQKAVAEKRGWKGAVTKWIHKDGSSRFLETSAEPIVDAQGNLTGFRGIDRDITERKQAEESIRQSEARYKALFDNINSGVAVYQAEKDGEDFIFVDFNRAGEKIEDITKDKLIGKSVLKVFPGVRDFGLFDVFQRVWRTGNAKHHPIAIYKDERIAGWRDNFVYKLPSGEVVAVYTDETERKKAEEERARLEEQLRQSHKMEAIGTLAGGIAHDFNNILFSMIGYTELALDDAPKGTMQYENLQEVLVAANRAKDLVQQILTFSRQADQEQKPVQVKLVVKEALKLLRASIPSTIDIKQNIQSKALVMGDATQIHQILMNLCTNAAHAMEKKGGILTIELADVELDSAFVSNHPDLRPGPYINLIVGDTGHGMSPAVLDKMFDPFFTTKATGEGTGMGLAVVHGIVHSHGGAIYAYSTLGKGSTFKVFLPAIEKHLKPEDAIEKPLPTGTENILFIDDEPAIVNMGKQILESLGYNVATRISSLEALELFKAQKDRFDLVISDLTMPQMTGDKLARSLMQIRPDIPIILCTGFSARIDEHKVKAMGVKAFISKPILKRVIAETIRTVLDAQ